MTWFKPDDGGSPITSYSVYFAQSDGVTYTKQLTDCDASTAAIMAALSCTVPALSLHKTPFSLPWGSSVYAKVIATNFYGDSFYSNAGNGAIILAVPDVPINLIENLQERSGSTLGITWNNGAD